MNTFLMICFMCIIGAAIGAFTNFIAIKMIFRPLEPIYIGSWRLPFTPGLIPRRRGELAEQLGTMVVKHLLTPDRIQQKFLDEKFQKEMTDFVQKEVQKILDSKDTLEQYLEKLGIPSATEKAQGHFDKYIDRKYDEMMEKYRHRSLNTIIPPDLLLKAEEKIPEISTYMLNKGIEYFSSIEGELRIQRLVDDFVKERSGMLGNMLQMLIGNVNVTERIQKEIIKILSSERTKDVVTALLKNEWEKLLNKEAVSLEEQFGEEQIRKSLKRAAAKVVRLEKLFATPVNELTKDFKENIVENLTPRIVQALTEWLSGQVENIMEKLRLADVVREQVESFSLQRIEEMLFLIIKKELKMITYLGGFLGGLIGIVQGIIVTLVG